MATKAERDAMRAQTQAQAGLPVTAKAKKAAESAEQTARDADLSNAETQKRIELPEKIPLTLFLPEPIGKKLCSIATQFSYEQVSELGVFEDLQSFSILMFEELAAFEWRAGDDATYAAALTTGRVRNAVRRILAKITSYDEPWDTEDEQGRKVTHRRPTVKELYDGMRLSTGEPDPVSMQKLASLLFGIYNTEVEHQKNARAATAPL